MSNSWVEQPSTSNLLKKTYMKEFLDVSGEIYVRNGNINVEGNITANGDLTCKNISLVTGSLDSGVNSEVQTALDEKQNTLTAGTNITINGETISSSAGGGIDKVSSSEADTLMDANVIISGDLNVTGNVIVSGSTVHTSDDRLKLNEQHITNSLEYINKLTPQIYNKMKSFDSSETSLPKDSGLIAQDIWYKTPELRHLVKTKESWKVQQMELSDNIKVDPSYGDFGWSDTPAAVNYVGFIAYLVKSVQELNDKFLTNETLIENYKASKSV
jgi:cytoskeletal protein CcmA (bactofilin family)